MTTRIVLIRSRPEVTDDVQAFLASHFGEIELIDLEPNDPGETLDQVTSAGAGAVVLRQNPLPQLLIGTNIPVLVVQEDGTCMRLVGFEAKLEPFTL